MTIGAGYITALAARQIAEAGLTDFEWAVTLPGTIGGAVFGNAGCFGGEIGDVVQNVNILHIENQKSKIKNLSNQECSFGYRNSIFKTKPMVILSATLKLNKGDSAEISRKMRDVLEKRKISQPLNCPSAGCMFKNYEIKPGETFNFQVPEEFLKNGRIPAGWLVEQAGGKQLTIGAVKISEVHGNFLLNTGLAKAEEVVSLINLARDTVKNKFGIQLEMEVQSM